MTATGSTPTGGGHSLATADDILEMRSITKTFPGVKALSEVTLRVRRGEVHAICGENGAGSGEQGPMRVPGTTTTRRAAQ